MLALLLAAGVAAATRNLVPFNITLNDQSPLVRFVPENVGEGWNSSFTKSPWSTYTQGQTGLGKSSHSINTSSTLQSNTTCGFYLDVESSEIIVMGDKGGSPPPDGAITVQLTDYKDTASAGGPAAVEGNTTVVPPSGGVRLSPGQLARVSNLDVNKSLLVRFTIDDKDPGTYTVRSFQVTTALLSDEADFKNVPQTVVPFVVDGAPNPAFGYQGLGWTTATSSVYYDTTTENVKELYRPSMGEAASLTINVPKHTSYMVVNGTVGPDRSYPAYQWTPTPPGLSPGNKSPPNASSPWVSAQVLYMQRLDPDESYVLNISPPAQGGLYLHSAIFSSANHSNGTIPVGKDGKGSSTGAIVGGVVGGIGGAVLIALIAFYFLFWRPRKRRDELEEREAANRDNAGFVPFGIDSAEPTFMQETDAGAVALPPSYDPQWDPAGSTMATTGSANTPSASEKAQLSPTSNSGSNISSLTPLAPYKVPFAAGAYEGADRLEDTSSRAPSDGGLPPGAASAHQSGSNRTAVNRQAR